MAITVNDIRNKQFKMEGRGYNCDEVDDFLDALAEQTEKLIRENTSLKNELAAAKEQAEAAKAAEKTALEAVHTPAVQQDAPPAFNEPSYFKNLETTLRETLISAQRIADETIDDARKKARRIVAEAEEHVNTLQEQSAQKMAEARADYDALKNASEEYRRNFTSLVEEQTRLLKDNPIVN